MGNDLALAGREGMEGAVGFPPTRVALPGAKGKIRMKNLSKLTCKPKLKGGNPSLNLDYSAGGQAGWRNIVRE